MAGSRHRTVKGPVHSHALATSPVWISSAFEVGGHMDEIPQVFAAVKRAGGEETLDFSCEMHVLSDVPSRCT